MAFPKKVSLSWLPPVNAIFDLSGPILCPGARKHYSSFIPNSSIRLIRLIVGWSGMRSFGKEYITAFLIREFLMIAVSCMLDPLLFYVLSESVPIPMLCGAEHLLFAGIKLFLCRGLVQ
ncbi:hypothetical protein PVAP13_J685712 [Panicum virgatum]|nr:hypothetical protein PVAP13_J685712 [Panicum virgatum]